MAGIITRDPEMQRICRTIEKVAPTSATVLMLGESGTGKELLRARAARPLAAAESSASSRSTARRSRRTCSRASCSATRRAPSPAPRSRRWARSRPRNGGTLFLDEIGDLPLALQAKLLRFLQERVIERVGGRQEIPVDVRIVCATHQNLKDQIATGRFREDLYYRLAEIVVDDSAAARAPGRRQRCSRTPSCARFAAEQRRGAMTLLPDAIDAIEAHAWPGNVRELENVIKRAVIMADGRDDRRGRRRPRATGADASAALNLRQVRDEAERNAVVRVLARVNGNLSKAAELLGVSRPTLYDLMHRFGLK